MVDKYFRQNWRQGKFIYGCQEGEEHVLYRYFTEAAHKSEHTEGDKLSDI